MNRMKPWMGKSAGLFALAFTASIAVGVGSANAAKEKVLVVAQGGDVAAIDNQQNVGPAKNALIQVYDWQKVRFRIVATPPYKGDFNIVRRNDQDVLPGPLYAWATVKKRPDGTVVKRFFLRPGMMFHSGNPITSADFKYSILRRAAFGRDSTNRKFGMYRYDGKPIPGAPRNMKADESIRIIDPLTYEIDLHHDNPLHFGHWAQRTLYDSVLMKKNAAKEDPWSKKFAAKNDAGSGPFTIERWAVGNEMVLKRFEDYWGPRPPLDKIIFKTVPDLSARVLLLKRGNIDIALDVPFREIKSLRKAPGVKVVESPSTNHLFIGLNPKIKPFDNKDLRLALIYSFPYDDVIQTIFGGAARRAYSSIPTPMQGSLDKPRYSTDMALAKKHFEKSGAKSGLTITMQWQVGQDQHKQIGILFGDNLKKIGVSLKLQQLPKGQFQTGLRKNTLGMFIRLYNIWIKTPELQHFVLYSGESHTNPIGHSIPGVDKTISDAILEGDNSKKAMMSAQARDKILDEAIHIFIAHPDYLLPMRKNVVGYVAQNTGLHHFWLMDKVDWMK
jgi:peptide/nickel transport system substrate-binding protein